VECEAQSKITSVPPKLRYLRVSRPEAVSEVQNRSSIFRRKKMF